MILDISIKLWIYSSLIVNDTLLNEMNMFERGRLYSRGIEMYPREDNKLLESKRKKTKKNLKMVHII